MKITSSTILSVIFFLSLQSTAFTEGPSGKTPTGSSQSMPNTSKSFDRQTNTYNSVQTTSNANSPTTTNDLSNTNTNAMNKEQMQNLDPSAVAGFDKEQMQNLDPSAVAGFDKEQMQNLDPSVMMAFDKDKVMNLDPSAMMGLAKQQILQMDQKALSGLNKDQAHNLTSESKVGVAEVVRTFKEFSLDVRKVIAEDPIRRLGGVGSFEDLAQMIASKASNEMLENKGWEPQKMAVKILEGLEKGSVGSQIPDSRKGAVVSILAGIFD